MGVGHRLAPSEGPKERVLVSQGPAMGVRAGANQSCANRPKGWELTRL